MRTLISLLLLLFTLTFSTTPGAYTQSKTSQQVWHVADHVSIDEANPLAVRTPAPTQTVGPIATNILLLPAISTETPTMMASLLPPTPGPGDWQADSHLDEEIGPEQSPSLPHADWIEYGTAQLPPCLGGGTACLPPAVNVVQLFLPMVIQ